MHELNKLLPLNEIEAINSNDNESNQSIKSSINIILKCIHADELAPCVRNTDFDELLRLVYVHSKLKYEFTKDLLDKLLNLLHELHFSDLISIPMKVRVLELMKALCKKGEKFYLEFKFSWKTFWDLIMIIIARENRHVIIASEDILSDYLIGLVGFLHSSRSYISYSGLQVGDGVDSLVYIATQKLKDTRYSICFEGLLMLINCLPSNFLNYESCLSQWVEMWIGSHSHSHWDYAWITLLARARKYCPNNSVMKSYWCNLLPLLLTKTQELLLNPSHSDFPSKYKVLLFRQYAADPIHWAIAKVAKLLHFIIIQNIYQDENNSPNNNSNKLVLVPPVYSSITPSSTCISALISAQVGIDLVLPNSVRFISFLQTLRTFFYPSNSDSSWTPSLALFLFTYVCQLCRHVGYELVSSISDEYKVPKSKEYLKQLHLPTVHYIVLNLLPYCMEGLYSKCSNMAASCAMSLKNLLEINPKLFTPIILPFLLAALDPSAVSQVHQAPMVLLTITLSFRSLMYPQPVLLQYLPDILKLSLTIIEASDLEKAHMILQLYSAILVWIPTTTMDYVDDSMILPSYMNVIQNKVGDVQMDKVLKSKDDISAIEFNTQLQVLSQYISSEWCECLMKKLFVLLEAHEAVDMHIADYLFRSLRPLHCPPSDDMKKKKIWEQRQQQQNELRKKVQNKVRHFFQTSAPLNAKKYSAKLMHAMVSADPSILTDVLNELLSPPQSSSISLLESYSPDKVAFRLRLAGGALRSATAGEIIKNLPLLEPIVTSTLYFNHEEKVVRTAVGQLLNDLLKGATSFYPIDVEPIYASNVLNPICSPNINSMKNLRWHIPTKDSISQILKLVKEVISQPMIAIRQLFLNISEKFEQDKVAANSSSIKKTEELIVSKLSMIQRALKGVAEILGDSSVHVNSDHQSDDDTVEGLSHLLSTGRSELLCTLDVPDKLYLQFLRLEVLEFLVFFQESTSTFASLSSHPLYSLKNNIMIQELWLQIFYIVVFQRMARSSNIDDKFQSPMEYVKLFGSSTISEVVYKTIKFNEKYKIEDENIDDVYAICFDRNNWKKHLTQIEYWHNHHISTNLISHLARNQHVRRCQQLSIAATRLCTIDNNDPFMRCLDLLVNNLCKHEYESIREVAVEYFEVMSRRFGFKMSAIVHNLISTLTTTDQETPLTYYSASGILSLLAQSSTQEKIHGGIDLMSYFLDTFLLHTQGILIAATQEIDKQEILLDAIVEVLLTYIKNWSAFAQDEKGFMQNLALKCVGFGSSHASDENKIECEKNITGLRLETFAAFVVLHTIGRENILQSSLSSSTTTAAIANDSTISVWKWVIQCLCNTKLHGQPVQTISLAALARLAWITKLETTTQQSSDKSQDSNKYYSAGINYARKHLSPLESDCCLKSIIISASQTHPKLSDDGLPAQWGRGIYSMIQAAKFLWNVFPRKLFGLSDHTYSYHFRVEDAAMYMSLAQAGLLGTNVSETFTLSNLTALFASTKDLPARNEGEICSNNATKAEFFAGLLRAWRSVADFSNINRDVEIVFLEYLCDHVERVSVDYCSDWQEALHFAYADIPCKISSKTNTFVELIPIYILDNLEKIRFKPGAAAQSVEESTFSSVDILFDQATESLCSQTKMIKLSYSSSVDLLVEQTTESLSSQTKMIKLAYSILEADQEACFVIDNNSLQSQIGLFIVNFLSQQPTDSSFISSVGWLISLLVLKTNKEHLAPVIYLCQKITTLCDALNNKYFRVLESTSNTNISNIALNTQFHKNALETLCILVWFSLNSLSIRQLNDAWVSILHTLFISTGIVSIFETARMCDFACWLISNNVIRISSSFENIENSKDLCSKFLDLFDVQSKIYSTSWHSKRILLKCVILLMSNNWHSLNNNEKKICKDIFSRLIDDSNPDVQQISQNGMISYLSYKTTLELTAIATIYTKNSDILADREKKSKKLQSKSETSNTSSFISGKVDLKHQNTVMMISCVLLATPYDLPTYLPALITSLCRHSSIASLRDTVTQTIQIFKRTHQDRWCEFKERFTAEQLDELQGNGAAQYHS